MRARFAPLFALSLGLTACVGGRSPAARFFQLQPAADMAATAGTLDPADFVVVRTVVLEDYLRQPRMARRVQPHEVKYNEFTRWAEPLDRNITRVLAENLRRALKTDKVSLASASLATGKSITLTVEVKRFEVQPDGNVLLSAAWLLQRQSETGAANVGAADLVTSATTGEPGALAAAQSTLLADLSARIAADIVALATSAAP